MTPARPRPRRGTGAGHDGRRPGRSPPRPGDGRSGSGTVLRSGPRRSPRRAPTSPPPPADAVAGTSATLCVVADGQALGAVLHGPGGVLAEGPYPGVLICASTVAPDEVVQIAREFAARSWTSACSATATTRATASCGCSPAARNEAFTTARPLLRGWARRSSIWAHSVPACG
ncbi:hypothetical protein LT493_00760 [Streptomyces tricolor]|nr:hypothetical protein [Streptomyces tricolor]